MVDDYAHHPTELRATLRAAREGEWSRVIAVFQPHLYSRTEFLHAEFAEALLEADVAVVTDVYGAREHPRPGVSGKLIVDSILRHSRNKPVVYLPRLGSIVDYLSRTTVPGDLVLTLGAGDIHRVGERFLETRLTGGACLPSSFTRELRAVEGVRLWTDCSAGSLHHHRHGRQGQAARDRGRHDAAVAVLRTVANLRRTLVLPGRRLEPSGRRRGIRGRGGQTGQGLPVRGGPARRRRRRLAGRWS